MVFIKLTNEMWIASGLQKVINSTEILKIESDRYIAYAQFKKASAMIDHPIHNLIRRQHIIPNLQIQKLRLQSQLTAEQRKFKQQIKAKHEMRMLSSHRNISKGTSIKSDEYYFQEKNATETSSVKDMSNSISFGMTFIFSFFMAGLTGYYFGIYFLSLQFVHAMIVAIVFIMATIVIQTLLFIIKQDKEDKRRAKKIKQKVTSTNIYNFKQPTPAPRNFEQANGVSKNRRAKVD